jgi:hypothetical protein
LLGWATAWSFDRLRLWIEKGISPEASRDRALIYLLSRGTVAFIWFYHGLVPKLLYHDKIELDLLGTIAPPNVLHAYLHAAFNPVTLNMSLAIFAAIALVARRDLPTAANCRRKPDQTV